MRRSDQSQSDSIPPALLSALGHPSAYTDDPSARDGISQVQTHLSYVFLTRERVYKLRKAVDLGFVDFSTREARNADCVREIHLNRRLAPDVYLGIAPLQGEGERVSVGGVREELAEPDARGVRPEHCVVMRRLPDRRDGLSLLERGELEGRHLDAVAVRFARFHEAQRLPGQALAGPEGLARRIVEPIVANFRALEEHAGKLVPPETRTRAETRARAFFEKNADRFEARAAAGRFVDGHGDLHLQHVWFETDDSEPLLIDCLEFREDLRQIDAASDVAFLAMDLAYRGRRDLAERFLRRYARVTDDFDLYGVVDYYVAYRAAVRSKVAALAAEEPEIAPEQRAAAAESTRRHLEMAADVLAPRERGMLVLLCGVIGTGKSSVAEVLADALGGVVVSSDRVRKRLAGLPPDAPRRGDWNEGIYTREWTARVYTGLLERAAPIVDSGRVALLDATFATRGLREPARRWAGEREVRTFLVETRCDEKIVLERLARRAAHRDDPSDAGPAHYARASASFEPPEEWPAEERVVLHTDDANGPEAAREVARRLGGTPPEGG